MRRASVYGIVVLALSAAPAFAQATKAQPAGGQAAPAAQAPSDQSKSSQQSNAQQSNADHMFVMHAAEGGLAEVDLGKLATEKASSEDVKKFAQRMVDDHGKANDELKTLAGKKSITLPSDVAAKDKATHDKLAKLSGAEFDRAYMRQMLTDHRKDVNEFRRESQSGKDPDVKAFAAKTLPTLEEHLKQAQSTDRSVVATSGSQKAAPKGTAGSAPKSPAGSTPKSPAGSK